MSKEHAMKTKMKRVVVLAARLCVTAFLVAALAGCDLLGFGAPVTATSRPEIPKPTSYIGSVPLQSEKLVIIGEIPLEFQPRVSAIIGDEGERLVEGLNELVLLIDNRNAVINPTLASSPSTELLPLEREPLLQLVRYWQRKGRVERYPAGTTTTVERTWTEGSKDESTYTFTETLALEGGGGIDFDLWGVLKGKLTVTLNIEFEASQTLSSETWMETETIDSFEVSLDDETNLVYCVWQLVEEFRFVDPVPDPVTGEYVPFTDSGYEFTEESLEPMVFLTEVVVPDSTPFSN
jgi:hypothetical protein